MEVHQCSGHVILNGSLRHVCIPLCGLEPGTEIATASPELVSCTDCLVKLEECKKCEHPDSCINSEGCLEKYEEARKLGVLDV